MNSEDIKVQTQATPPTETLKIIILQRRNTCINAIQDYFKRVHANSTPPAHLVKAPIEALFLEIEPALERTITADAYKKYKEDVFKGDANTCINAFRSMNKWLDQRNITRVDTGRKIDTTNVEEENEEKGL